MSRGGRKLVQTGPAYGYAHPDTRLPPPAGVDPNQRLGFDLELLGWVPAEQVKCRGSPESSCSTRVL